MKNIIIILLFFFTTTLIHAQDKTIFPEINNLSEVKSFSKNTSTWRDFYYSPFQYRIENDGSVYIEKERRNPFCGFGLPDGILLGFNNGEWGGGLIFYSNSNSQLLYPVIHENVQEIFLFNKSIYVLSGIAHLGINTGKLYKLEKKDDKWIVIESFILPGEPETYFVDKSQVYIVTYDSLCSFDGKIINIILKDQLWGSLYPSTIIKYEKNIAIGMRGCIVIYSIENNKVRYYY